MKKSYLISSGESLTKYTRKVIHSGRFTPDELDELEILEIEKQGTLFPFGRNITSGGSSNQKAAFNFLHCSYCEKKTTHIGGSCASCVNRDAFYDARCDQCSIITKHKQNVGCWNCFRKSYYMKSECEICAKETTHTINGKCFGCVNRKRLEKKLCDNCNGVRTHSGGKCYGCARKNSYSEAFCELCQKETRHLGDSCVNCKRRAKYVKNFCESCGKTTTHAGDSCMSCRVVTRAKCDLCKTITKHRAGRCLEIHEPGWTKIYQVDEEVGA